MASPIGVFGYQTSNIALTATGPMAILDDVAPEALASKLDLTIDLANAASSWPKR